MRTTMSPFGPSNRWRNWSSAEDAQLQAAIQANESLENIALAHARTMGAIVSRVKKLDITLSAEQEEERE